MLLTDDDALALRCRSLRNLCFQPARRFVHEEIGWNMRITNLQAALGVAQLEKLNKTTARKREIGFRYTELSIFRKNFGENLAFLFRLAGYRAAPATNSRYARQFEQQSVPELRVT